MSQTLSYNICIKVALLSGLGSLTLGACQNNSNASETVEKQNFIAVGNSAVPTHHASIFLAFENLDGTAERYMRASQLLERMGARPMNQEIDKAQHWYSLAVSLDAQITEKYPPFRGRVKGPAYREHKLGAGQSDTIHEVYYAAEAAILSVKTRQGLVRLEVEAKGKEKSVCQIMADNNAASCNWTPIYTTPYEITLTNMSGEDISYVLMSN